MLEDLVDDERRAVQLAQDKENEPELLLEELSRFEQAEMLSASLISVCGNLLVEVSLKECDEDEPGVDKQLDFICRWILKGIDMEMAFPGLENDLNPPSYSIDPACSFGIPDLFFYIGDEDFPSQKRQLGFAWMEPSVSLLILEKLSPSFGSNMVRHRNSHDTDRKPLLCSGQESLVKRAVSLQMSKQIKTFAIRCIEGNFMPIASEIESALRANRPEDLQREVAQVTKDQISLLQNLQDERGGTLIITAIKCEAEGDECFSQNLIGSLKLQ